MAPFVLIVEMVKKPISSMALHTDQDYTSTPPAVAYMADGFLFNVLGQQGNISPTTTERPQYLFIQNCLENAQTDQESCE